MAGQILESALNAVNGNVEDKQRFMSALYATNIETPKGPVKLDKYHDIVQNVYIYRIVDDGGTPKEKLLKTYQGVGQFWDRTQAELAQFPFGKLKGKWTTMTMTQLQKIGGATANVSA